MWKLLLSVPGVLVLIAATVLTLRAEPRRDAFQHAEELWQTGRVTEAYRAFNQLPDESALVYVRRAQIALLRGACAEAQQAAAAALHRPTRRDEAALAHLVLAQCAARAGDHEYAAAEWSAVDPRSPLYPLSFILQGEAALQDGRLTEAAEQYREVLSLPLREPWHSFARYRYALAIAAGNADESMGVLAEIPATLPPPSRDTQPFISLPPEQIVTQARQLAVILQEPAELRTHLLGQFLLEQGLYRAAMSQLERVPADSPSAVLSRTQAAYARWKLGQTAAAIEQLRELAVVAPDDPSVATLYASVMVQAGQIDVAGTALDAAEIQHPLDPAIALVRSDVLAARSEYGRALVERRRARDIAQPDIRGRYAIALAEQYLTLTHDLCGGGIQAAKEATQIAPNDPAAWQVLAATFYHCRRYSEAMAAAETGLTHAPDSVALHFYHGAAQWMRGDRESAHSSLLGAADRAPASDWRRRVEELLFP